MRVSVDGKTLELVQGDITQQSVDAIVNAANSALAGGGGVDGAIHRGGGPEIMAETDRRYPEGCPTGQAVITCAGNLAARFVIHAVGPVWSGGGSGEAELLRSAYLHSLELADDAGCQSVALPALSTGAYGYPMREAARIALSVSREFLRSGRGVTLIRYVLFGQPALETFRDVLGELAESS